MMSLILYLTKSANIQSINVKSKFFYLFGVLFLFLLIILFKDKNIYLFYEHALNANSSLAEKIINNKVTLLFFSL